MSKEKSKSTSGWNSIKEYEHRKMNLKCEKHVEKKWYLKNPKARLRG
jgi:hypothetical protein